MRPRRARPPRAWRPVGLRRTVQHLRWDLGAHDAACMLSTLLASSQHCMHDRIAAHAPATLHAGVEPIGSLRRRPDERPGRNPRVGDMRLVEPAQRLVEVHSDGGRRVGRVRRGLLVRARRPAGGADAAPGLLHPHLLLRYLLLPHHGPLELGAGASKREPPKREAPLGRAHAPAASASCGGRDGCRPSRPTRTRMATGARQAPRPCARRRARPRPRRTPWRGCRRDGRRPLDADL